MDFIDYLEALTEKVDKVIVCPIGTIEDQYHTESREVNVWARKLSILENEKVWLKS